MHSFQSADVDLQIQLQESFLKFIQIFYEIRNGRAFVLSEPAGRESHYLTLCRELKRFFHLQCNRLLINIPPGHGKSTLMVYFIAWAFTQYPDCQFLYISYSKSLAEKHTAEIKAIMSLSLYRYLFGVEIAKDTKAKAHFKTLQGGTVTAFGSSGAITGQDAGLPNQNRFTGCVIIDDAHKPDEVHSDTMRQSVINNYNQTIKPRPRADNVGMVFIGQLLHEADLGSFLGRDEDGFTWNKVKLKSIDEAGNALAPNIISLEKLKIEQKFNPYVFASQYQQDPIPAGGGIFKKDWFPLLDIMPKILATYITVDTAETEQEYNDASVFSFFGIYQPQVHGKELPDQYALHWLDCLEIRVEPKDLQQTFLDFWASCMNFSVKPKFIGIEKKSTGVTLCSVLKTIPGLRILEIERTRTSGSKIARFLNCQPYVAQQLISLPTNRPHTEKCLEHMSRITANNSHRHDDICDTLADGIKLGLMDKIILNSENNVHQYSDIAKDLYSQRSRLDFLRKKAYR